MKRYLSAALVCITLGLTGSVAATEKSEGEYPTRPVRIVVPFPPGQTVDLVGRLIAESLTQAFGRTFIVDNRPGASGTIGSSLVARAAPDGYTLLIVSAGTLAGNTALWKQKLPYNAVKDFQPVINHITTPQILIASPTLPYKTVQEIVKYAKANPGKMSYASPGVGNSSHLAMELFKRRAGVDIVHVPYQGSPAAFTDIMAGTIPIMFEAASGVIGHVRAGRIRVIATGGEKRAVFLPEVPTIAESGYPGYVAEPWVGLAAPAGTPKPLVARIYEEARKPLLTADGKAKIINLGMEPSGMGPDEFSARIKAEIERLSKVVNDANIRLE